MGEDQNASDEMGGGTSSDANLDVMGDFGQSNVVDDYLHMQTDQNFGHSNVVDDLNVQPNQNKGDVMGDGTISVENLDVVMYDNWTINIVRYDNSSTLLVLLIN